MQVRSYLYTAAFLLATAAPVAYAQGSGSMPLRSFDGVEEISNFEIEGISMNTPAAEIHGILEANGYTLADDRPSLRTFVKGSVTDAYRGVAGAPGYVLRISETDTLRTVFLQRPPVRMSGQQARALTPSPVPDSIDARLGIELTALICEHTTEPKEKHRMCKPNTDLLIGPGMPYALGLSKDPVIRAWVDVRGHTGGVRITRYK